MEIYIIMAAMIIFLCLVASSISNKIGVPTLILFIILGMLFGSEGIVGIQFEDYNFANYICSFALIYIMFYGGFGTNWKMARPVVVKAGILSTLGVVLTALFTGLFCFWVSDMDLLESILLGCVMASTDAAAVFYILRVKRLNLKHGMASLLELESGSNDPMANMLTIILLGIATGTNANHIWVTFILQFVVGSLIGSVLGIAAGYGLKKLEVMSEGLDMIFVFAIALFSYALAGVCGGNGYLSVYITGIILGNTKIPNKPALVHFFDGVTNLFQMLVFFLLGLLAFPSQIMSCLGVALLICVFLIFIARPITVAMLLSPFKVSFKEQILISWAGLRGASAIVFAIMVAVSGAYEENQIFNIVFCVAMLSVAIQGTLLPVLAKKLDLIDDETPVAMTFNDYSDEKNVRIINILVGAHHPWIGKTISEIHFPHQSLAVLIKRKDEHVIPKGDTKLEENDIVLLSSEYEADVSNVQIQEISISKNSNWVGKSIAECKIPKEQIIILIRRGEENIIPSGSTVIMANDVLLTCSLKS